MPWNDRSGSARPIARPSRPSSAQLYSRQVDGTLTTWLASRDALERSWDGSVPFARVLEAAVSVRLLREDELRIEGTEPRPFVRLGHDALAKVAAAWQMERDEKERLRQERAEAERERKKRLQQIRKLVACIGLAAGLAILFGVIGFWAMQQKSLAQHSQEKAQDSLRVASQGVDDLLTEVADVDLADVPQMGPVRKRLLEKAQVAYRELLSKEGNEKDPVLLWVAGKARSRLGDIREMMGDYEEAEQSYLQAIERLEALSARFPENAEYRRVLVRSHLGLGVLYKKTSRFRDAESSLMAAFRRGETLATSGAPPDRRLLAEIDYQRGAVSARQEELLGRLRSPLSDRARQSEQSYRAALRVLEGVAKEYPERPDQRAKRGSYLNNLGKFLTATDRADEAEKMFLEAITLIRPGAADRIARFWEQKKYLEAIDQVQGSSPLSPGERWQLARNENNLGVLFFKQERYDLSSKLSETSKEYLEKLSQEFPDVTQYRQELASLYHNMGLAEIRRKQGSKALPYLRRALDLCKELMDQPQGGAVPDLRRQLAIADAGLAPRTGCCLSNLFKGSKGVESRSAAEQAIRYDEAALELNPEDPDIQLGLWEDYRLLPVVLRTFPDQIDRAAQASKELPRLLPLDLDSYLFAAESLAMCASASKDPLQDYGGEAVRMLKKAVEKGLLHNAKQLGKVRLPALKDREDFKELRRVAGLSATRLIRGRGTSRASLPLAHRLDRLFRTDRLDLRYTDWQ